VVFPALSGRRSLSVGRKPALPFLNGPLMNGNRPILSRRGFRLVALIVAGVCVLAIAAGAFAFSYPGVRDLALTAGVSPHLARFYPLLFGAVLIVACAAVITLRGVLRAYAWLAALVIIGAIGTADTVHVLSITVPKRPLEATIAIAPWVVLLTGLTLLDAMIRRAPSRRTGAAGPVSANGRGPATGSPDSTAEQPAGAVVVPLSTLMHDSPTAPVIRTRAAAGWPAADGSWPQANASWPQADAIPTQAPAGQATAGASWPQADASWAQADAIPTDAPAGQPTADASWAQADAIPTQAAAGQPTTDASWPQADAIPTEADAGQPTADAGPALVTASEPEARDGQPEAAGSATQTSAGPAAADAAQPDAAQPAAAESVARVPQAPPTPQPPE